MSEHVPDDLLSAFVDGEVEERVAIHIAEHVDACPACATRAATLEPLASAFAAAEDPLPPPDLAEAVLAELDRPIAPPVAEIAIGFGLIATAGGVAALAGDPVALIVRVGVALDTLTSLGGGVASSTFVTSAALLTGTLACLAAARVALDDERST